MPETNKINLLLLPGLLTDARLYQFQVEDLSDMVARQGREMDRLTRLTGLLATREAEREAMFGGAPAADQKPPHW